MNIYLVHGSSKGLLWKGPFEIPPQTWIAEFTVSSTNHYSVGLTGLLAGRVSAVSQWQRVSHGKRNTPRGSSKGIFMGGPLETDPLAF